MCTRRRRRARHDALPLDAIDCLFESASIAVHDTVAGYAHPSFPPGRPLLEAVADLIHRIHADFTFDPQATTVATSLRDVVTMRRGVCQTSRGWVSHACVRRALPRAMSAATWRRYRRRGSRDSPEWMRRTRGWPFTVQDSAGWTSIPPTTCSPLPHMSRWRTRLCRCESGPRRDLGGGQHRFRSASTCCGPRPENGSGSRCQRIPDRTRGRPCFSERSALVSNCRKLADVASPVTTLSIAGDEPLGHARRARAPGCQGRGRSQR